MSIKSLGKRLASKILYSPRNRVDIVVKTIDYHHVFEGKKIVITGGGRGIGYAIAKKLVGEGGDVIIVGRNIKKMEFVCEELKPHVHYIEQDLSENFDYKEFINRCVEIFGATIDILVLNAGISLHEKSFLEVTRQGFDLQYNVNLKTSYFLAQSFLEYKLNREESGELLFISSETGDKSVDIPYGMTKASINSLVGGLARRVYQRGIRVNAISPGVTFTDMTNNEKDRMDFSNSGIAGRFFLPDEIAEVAFFILSDASKSINGEIIHCDAGSHLKINGYESEYSF